MMFSAEAHLVFQQCLSNNSEYLSALFMCNEVANAIKVIPLKLFYYQTFFETWRNEHS